jgi:hypothetical protein
MAPLLPCCCNSYWGRCREQWTTVRTLWFACLTLSNIVICYRLIFHIAVYTSKAIIRVCWLLFGLRLCKSVRFIYIGFIFILASRLTFFVLNFEFWNSFSAYVLVKWCHINCPLLIQFPPNVVVEWLALPLGIREVPDSNFSPETVYFDWFFKVFCPSRWMPR